MIPVNFMPLIASQWPYILGGIFFYIILFISFDKTRENIRSEDDKIKRRQSKSAKGNQTLRPLDLEEWNEFMDDLTLDDGHDWETIQPQAVPSESAILKQSEDYLQDLRPRRAFRGDYADEQVPMGVLENIIASAGSAPSSGGAQPWVFVVVRGAELKKKIRQILEPFDLIQRITQSDETNESKMRLRKLISKCCLEEAPCLIVLMKRDDVSEESEAKTGSSEQFSQVSCSMAAGFLLTAIQKAGLSTCTLMPAFGHEEVRHLLDRPDNEHPFMMFPLGFPSPSGEIQIPKIVRRSLDELMTVKDD